MTHGWTWGLPSVAMLLDRGAAIEETNIVSATSLIAAARNGHDSTVALLLGRGAAIEAKEKDGIQASLPLSLWPCLDRVAASGPRRCD